MWIFNDFPFLTDDSGLKYLLNFFAAGDGAGVTRGLAQAGASGVQAARAILKRLS